MDEPPSATMLCLAQEKGEDEGTMGTRNHDFPASREYISSSCMGANTRRPDRPVMRPGSRPDRGLDRSCSPKSVPFHTDSGIGLRRSQNLRATGSGTSARGQPPDQSS